MSPSTTRTSVPPPPSDKVAVVVNGNAKQVTDELVEMLDQIVQSGDLFVSRSLDEGREIARTIVAKGYNTVLTGGGDGTFVQMVTWVSREAERKNAKPPRFGFLKLGTGNALAWVVGAQNEKGRGVVADLARLRTEGGSRKLRLIETEGVLTPFAGLGVDAICLTHYNQTKDMLRRIPIVKRHAAGGFAYFVSIVGRSMPEYTFRSHPMVRVVNEGLPADRIGVDGRPVGSPVLAGEVLYEGPAHMVSMSTIPYWGLGARMFPFANDREDRFQVRVADPNPWEVARYIRKWLDGTHRSNKVHDFLVEKVSIHYAEPMPMQIGGDPIGARTDVVATLAKPIEVVDYYSPPPV